MRTTTKIFLSLTVVAFIACSDQYDVNITEVGEQVSEVLSAVSAETFFSSVFVTTYRPDVEEQAVVFKGEITEMKQSILVTYGFMWYDPNQPNLEINTIELGTTSEKIAFSVDLNDLPKKDNLVVCTFLRHGEDGEQHELIGDEVPFSNL